MESEKPIHLTPDRSTGFGNQIQAWAQDLLRTSVSEVKIRGWGKSFVWGVLGLAPRTAPTDTVGFILQISSSLFLYEHMHS